MKKMNVVLWVGQILLAILFLSGGILKAFLYDRAYQMWAWVRDFSKTFVTFVGIMDLLAGLGVILPKLTGIWPWLTTLAALGAVVILILAVYLHLKRKEYKDGAMNSVFAALALFVFIGRLFWP